MTYFGFLLFPLAVTFNLPAGKPRLLGIAYTAGVALAGATGLGLLIIDPNAPRPGGINPVSLFQVFFWGSVLSTWLSAVVGRNVLGR